MQPIHGIFAGFTSAQSHHNNLFNHRLQPLQRVWGAESRRPQVAEVLFPGVFTIQRITANAITTDQTTAGFKWEIHLRHPDGGYTFTPVTSGTHNVGEREWSIDLDPTRWPLKEGWPNERQTDNILDITFPTPIQAMAGQLRIINHHGWCQAINLQFWGEKTSDLPQPAHDILKDYQTDLRAFWFSEAQ